MAVIQARGLSKRYGGKLAVDNLTFEVKPGIVTGFLGPNGAGKSMTMRLMLDLDRGEGTTTFDERRYRELRDPLREIGALLEAKAFHPTRSPGRSRGGSRSAWGSGSAWPPRCSASRTR
jgi:ABC-2 type transport system ATP-binding protein